MGAQRGLELHVLDRATEGAKPEAVHALGGRYHSGDVTEIAEEIEPDIVVECTGVAELVAGAMQHTAPGAIVCLTGVAVVAHPQRGRRARSTTSSCSRTTWCSGR